MHDARTARKIELHLPWGAIEDAGSGRRTGLGLVETAHRLATSSTAAPAARPDEVDQLVEYPGWRRAATPDPGQRQASSRSPRSVIV